MSEWLVIDKVGDLYFFNRTQDIAKHFCLTLNQTNGAYQYCLRSGCYSPSQKIYIQRLFNDKTRPPRDFKKTHFKWHLRKLYPNIINDAI